MITCLSPNGAQLTQGTEEISQLLVATIRGAYTLDRAARGEHWTVSRVVLEDFQVSSILSEPRSGRLFAGTHGNEGLWASDDGGATWAEKRTGLQSRHIYTVKAQPRGDATVIWVGTEPAMLYRSDDLGESFAAVSTLRDVPDTEKWQFPPPPHVAHVKHIAFHPSEPGTLYVCVEQGALLKSIDDGRTWNELHGYEQPDMDVKFRHDTHRVVIRPSDRRTLYLSAGEGVYKSEDAGSSWRQLQSRFDRVGYPDSLFIDPRDDSVVFLGGAGDAPEDWRNTRTSRATVIRSVDGGSTWSEMHQGMPDPLRGNIEAMAHHHAGDYLGILAGTATGEIYLTEDDGRSWSCIADGLPPISKAGHYRWFLSDEERAKVVDKMRRWKGHASV